MPAQPQQSNTDSSMGPVWVMVLLIVTSIIIWELAHNQIIRFVFLINTLQAELVHLVLGKQVLAPEINFMRVTNPSVVTWDQLINVTYNIGVYMRYPYTLIMGILALILYRSDITLRFRKTHSMNTLKSQEERNWPYIMPVAKIDLVNQDVNEGPWAMAMTPMEFAKKYHLLRKDDVLLDNPSPGQEMTAGIRRGDAKRVFTLQLGPYWTDFEHCSPHGRALAAAFMCRINRDKKSASEILDTLSRSYASGKLDCSVADAAIKKYANQPNIREITDSHAYFLTAIASLLVAARDDGVMPSAEFLWLKPTDRRLWYMLNCVGRQTPYAEVAGAFAHWRAERAMGRRSLVPMIDEAIKALEIAVKEVKLSKKELEALRP